MQQFVQPSGRLFASAPGPVRNRTVCGWDSLYQDGSVLYSQILLIVGNDRQIIWLHQELNWAVHFPMLQLPHLQTGDNITALRGWDHIALLHL